MKSLKSQQGFTLLELIMVMAVIAVLSLAYAKLKPAINFLSTKNEIAAGVDLISADAYSNKGNAPNYTDLSFSSLCENGYLNEIMCGENNDGVGSNPFGGDWSVEVSDIYGAAHIMITISGISSGRFMDLANTLAARSYKICRDADDCASIILKAPSEDSSSGEITVHM